MANRQSVQVSQQLCEGVVMTDTDRPRCAVTSVFTATLLCHCYVTVQKKKKENILI